MKHLEEAIEEMTDVQKNHIRVEGNKVIFWVQDGPIKESGVNGIQATDMLEYCKHLFTSLNKAYECDENHITVNAINVALDAQKLRTKDREKRGVEGQSKA